MRSYGDACRFAFALDVVGERWALLVVRELLLGPKRFTEIRAGLPGASPNILSERLRELEGAGVIRRRKLAPPAGSSVYELTEWGAELEPVVTRLGAWGARSPLQPAGTRIGIDSIALALRSLFDPERAGEISAVYELRVDGDRFTVSVDAGEIGLRRGAAQEPAVAIEGGPAELAALITGEVSLDAALESGALAIEGGRREVARFLRLFPMPEPCASAGCQGALVAESGVAVTV
ncbi:MAG TPA: winged helix-turn-helix transcriptional regulator [Solirubrobacterales bacterium]|jgi:DNA-binding HxlR family transcriptional regulator